MLVTTVPHVLIGIAAILFKIDYDSDAKTFAPPTVEVQKEGTVQSPSMKSDSEDEPTQWIPFNFYVPDGVNVRSINKDEKGEFITNGSNPFTYSFVSSMNHTVYVFDAIGRPNEMLEFTLEVRLN